MSWCKKRIQFQTQKSRRRQTRFSRKKIFLNFLLFWKLLPRRWKNKHCLFAQGIVGGLGDLWWKKIAPSYLNKKGFSSPPSFWGKRGVVHLTLGAMFLQGKGGRRRRRRRRRRKYLPRTHQNIFGWVAAAADFPSLVQLEQWGPA